MSPSTGRSVAERRTIGGSGLSTPPLILGGNVFGWTADRATSFAVLDAFVAAGGNTIDTADVYSAWVPGNRGGESETLIGEWLHARGRRDDVQIVTKVGMMPGEGGELLQPSRIAAAVEASLKRLRTDYIDLYLAHRDDEGTPQEAVLRAFDQLVKAGKVRAIGASNFSADRLASALDISRNEGIAGYCALEPHYNLLERGHFEGALQQLCVERDIGVTPYYGLASGYLTGKYRSSDDLAKSPRGASAARYMDGRGPAVLRAMDEIAAEAGATLPQIALAWLAAQPAVTAPIASATSAAQVEELAGVFTLRLTDEQLARLTEAGR